MRSIHFAILIPTLMSCSVLNDITGTRANSIGLTSQETIELAELPDPPANMEPLWAFVDNVQPLAGTIKLDSSLQKKEKTPVDLVALASEVEKEIRSQAAQCSHFRIFDVPTRSDAGIASDATSTISESSINDARAKLSKEAHYVLRARISRLDIGPKITSKDASFSRVENNAEGGIEVFRVQRKVTMHLHIDLIATGRGDGEFGLPGELVASGQASRSIAVVTNEKIIDKVVTMDQDHNVTVERKKDATIDDEESVEFADERFVPTVASVTVRDSLINLLESAHDKFARATQAIQARRAATQTQPKK